MIPGRLERSFLSLLVLISPALVVPTAQSGSCYHLTQTCKIWATYCTEQHLNNGVLIGDSVRIIDANGDGTFETIE
jgi:hypothetical protein